MFPELIYGRALALYQLERYEEADEALQRAIGRLPKVARYLTASTVEAPQMNEHGIAIGGDDQAYVYPMEALPLWEVAPGALQWLGEAAAGVHAE